MASKRSAEANSSFQSQHTVWPDVLPEAPAGHSEAHGGQLRRGLQARQVSNCANFSSGPPEFLICGGGGLEPPPPDKEGVFPSVGLGALLVHSLEIQFWPCAAALPHWVCAEKNHASLATHLPPLQLKARGHSSKTRTFSDSRTRIAC